LLHFDLAHGTVAGVPVLGRSVAAIRSSLGPPDYVERYRRRVDLGYGSRAAPRVEVIANGTAWALAFVDAGDTEARLGPILRLAPRAMERRIATRYGGVFHRIRRYHCDVRGCFGTFLDGTRTRRLLFGIARGRRYVDLQLVHPPNG
jgi:hypothetical protein